MKKLLVTGSNGLLGQKITEAILKYEQPPFEYIASSRGVDRYGESAYLYLDLDITQYEQVAEAIDRHQPDVIINTAAMANVDACERNPEKSYEVNVNAVSNLVGICERKNIHFIHLSTDFVFDGEEGPYEEDDLPNPVNTYGKHKLTAEKLIQQSTCRWSIVRTILVYGIVRDLSRSNIVLWAKNALESGQSIRVVNDQWRMPTLAEDLAKACLTIAERSATGLYHISGKDMFSICEIVEAVAEHYHLDASFICKEQSASLGQDARRPKRTGFILEKAYERLDYVPHSFGEGLKLLDEQLKLLQA
ncbi:SDR family oxidoreductase [Olivibacter sp. XZL3]|uniref:SDR family oxidoreductase n=1 Tax=Olivibacter sp. XZL3 TaxID=1735116 RepID=UPI0010662400|nr:SDR family oxidoreductase [Olivibacter sp. XZL3]